MYCNFFLKIFHYSTSSFWSVCGYQGNQLLQTSLHRFCVSLFLVLVVLSAFSSIQCRKPLKTLYPYSFHFLDCKISNTCGLPPLLFNCYYISTFSPHSFSLHIYIIHKFKLQCVDLNKRVLLR